MWATPCGPSNRRIRLKFMAWPNANSVTPRSPPLRFKGMNRTKCLTCPRYGWKSRNIAPRSSLSALRAYHQAAFPADISQPVQYGRASKRRQFTLTSITLSRASARANCWRICTARP